MEASKFLIDGEWVLSGVKRPVVNPFDSSVAGEVYQASPGQIDTAIQAATRAFQQTRRLSSYQRAAILRFVARELEAGREEFARLITAETAKPISLSRAEVDRSMFTFSIASEEATRIEGAVLPLDVTGSAGSRIALVRRFPLGPVSAITPFNFPLNLVAHKLGPAFAAGNTVVLKPSSSAPMVALLLGRILERSGLPKGALNIVPCLADEGEQLITDQRIKLVSFTGSPAVGWGIKARSGKKRVVLELGGNAGVIVDKSADIELALQRIVQGAYANAGQSCISVQRIYVHSSLYPRFEERFVTMSRSVAVGDPKDERTLVGPMISVKAAENVEGWIREAAAGGARVLCGGARKGAFLEPTVLVNVSPEMNVCCREVFAPVVTLEEFVDFKDAVARINNSAFGLQAGVFSNDLGNITFAYEHLEVGGVIVNDSSAYRVDSMPYGGVKDSGLGREGIKYAIEEMTEMKLLGLNLSA